MTFLTKSTGETTQKQTTHQTDSNNDPMPKNSVVNAAVESVRWQAPSDQEIDEGDDNDQINVMWRVVGGQFDNRVVFQKLRVLSADGKKRDNALDFYAAQDTILNEGFLLEMGEEPTDEELEKAWTGKQAQLTLDVWFKGKGKDKEPGGNYVKAVSPVGQVPAGDAAEGGRRRRRASTEETTPAETTPEPTTRRRRRSA